jgi:uncharacterized repeat protein (TIGR02543 family)
MLIIPVFRISATPTTIETNPPTSYITVAKTLSIDVNVTDVTLLTSWQFTIYFNNSVLNCTGVTEGPFLKSGGGTYFGNNINNNYNSTYGSVQAYSTLLGNTNVNGSGVLATITFNASAVGDSPLHLSDTKLGDQNIPPQPITHTTIDGTVHVQAFTLGITIVGSGSVALNNTGPYYHYGEAVNLTATAAIGYSFSSWSGGLTGSANPATLIMAGDTLVTATFTQDQYTLTITTSGSGSVTKNPNQATYTYGTNVTLTANANMGWTFASWSGDASGTTNPTTVNMTGNKAVTASFTQNVYTLTINIIGSGTVSKNNTGILHYGDVVQLTANPSTGWSFDHWSDNLTGSVNPSALTITGNMFVTATFTQNIYTLSVTVDPVGSGTVNLNNSGPYHYGDVIQLSASPTIGWSFDHWSGSLIGSSNPATLTINGNMAVTANFIQNVYTVTTNVVGSGAVNRDSPGPYHYNDVVQLTAVPSAGWSFDHWSGYLSGSTNPTTLTMTANVTVTANFIQNHYTLSVIVDPVGSGTVSLNNSGPYLYGDVVQLSASPTAGWSFDHWSGSLTGNPATITIVANVSITATFIQNVYTLTVNVIGQGSVGVSPPGPYYNYGDTVTLTPSASLGWIFQYWSGDLLGSANPASKIMTGNFSVTAHFTQKPLLQMSPTSRTCRMYSEAFNVTVNISNALNVSDFAFEIHYNATLLTYVSITWTAWGSGTINVAGGIITGYTSGAPINGTQTLVTIRFEATFYHVWKSGAVNDVSDIIFIQGANISYPAGSDLRYVRGGLNQIDVGTDFVYTFSPIRGDVNNDGSVELFDLRLVAAYFGIKSGDALWGQAVTYDLDNSGAIDVFDLRTIAVDIPYTYVPPP